jgi:catechol 2,3-dioxygenase
MAMHMGHVAFQSPDPHASARFLQQILGLRETVSEANRVFLTCNEHHHEVEFLRGDAPGLDHVGLEVEDEAEIDGLRDRLIAEGAQILTEDLSEPGVGSGMRFVGPMGATFEVYCAMERQAFTIENYLQPQARRFGHVTFSTEDKDDTIRFLGDVMGFRLSDKAAHLAWMRCDSDHHGIGLVETGSNTVHHYAFQMQDLGALGQYADHLARLGLSMLWGIGRHGPGRNLFGYIADPCNAIVETYADLLTIHDDEHYRPIDWGEVGGRALNLWGPASPEGWRDYGVPILAPKPSGGAQRAR